MSELSLTHVRSGRVMTVNGPIPSSEMGVTMMHEHLQNDCRCWWHPPSEPERQYLAEGPVRIEILSELRQDPFVNRHNIALDDLDLAIEELADFAALGGRTIVDPTCRGIGRDPGALRQISARTGLQIVMGAGYYLASSMPEAVDRKSAEDIADEIVHEALTGVDGTDARIGLIVSNHRTQSRFSFRVRMKHSAQPLPSGARTKAGELSAPRKRTSRWKSRLMYWLPWSWRILRPVATSLPNAPKLRRTPCRIGSSASWRVAAALGPTHSAEQ